MLGRICAGLPAVLIAMLFAMPAVCAAATAEVPSPDGIAHYILATRYDLLGQGAQALQEYEQAALLAPDALEPRLRLGAGYLDLGRNDEALVHLQQAVRIAPSDPSAHYFLAILHASRRDLKRTALEYEAILRNVSPAKLKDPLLYLNLADIYLMTGEEAQAGANLEKAFLLAPQDTRIAFTLGIFYMEHHERAKGIAALRQCIEVDPWHEGCLNSLGYTYAEDAANLDEAEKLVQRALEIDPGNPVYTDSLGWVYFQQKKYIDALKELSYAAEKVRDPEVFDHLAQVYLKLGQKDLARKFWDASLALDPDQPAIRAWLKELDKAVP